MALTVEMVGTDVLMLDPDNLRKHPVRNLEAIKASLARFGQQHPIVAGNDNVVVKGNGTLIAARELGWTEIACVRTDLAGAERIAYAIADNRTAELAEWDYEGLGAALRALEAEGLAEAAGFNAEELAALAGVIAAHDAEGDIPHVPAIRPNEVRVLVAETEARDEIANAVERAVEPFGAAALVERSW